MTEDDLLGRHYRASLDLAAPADREGCPGPDELARLVSGDGAEPDRLRTLDHVMGCRHCLPEFELLRSIRVADDREAARGRGRSSLANLRLPLGIAAALVAVVAAGLARRAEPSDPAVLVPPDSFVLGPISARAARGAEQATAAPATVTAQPPRFGEADSVRLPAIDPEVLLASPTIPTAPAASTFPLLEPVGEVTGAPRLVWRSVSGVERYRVELVDAAGEVVLVAVTTDTVHTLPPGVTLPTDAELGWTLLAEHEGRFVDVVSTSFTIRR